MTESAQVGVRRASDPAVYRVPGEISGRWAVLVIFVAAVIATFGDASAGLDGTGLRLLVTTFVVLLILNLSGSLVVVLATRRRGDSVRLTTRPAMLVVLLFAMLFARTTKIEPALIVGTMMAVDFGVEVPRAREAARSLVGALWACLVGVVAWIGYWDVGRTAKGFSSGSPQEWLATVPSWMTVLGRQDDPLSVLHRLVTVQDGLALLAIAALASTPISLLPLAFLDGSAIWRWSKWLWGGCYVVCITLVSFVLLPLPNSWGAPSRGVRGWFAVLGLYAVVAIGFWLYFRFRSVRADPGWSVSTTAEVEPQSTADSAPPSVGGGSWDALGR